MIEENKPILSVKNLSVAFRTGNAVVDAVRDISFDLYPGETLAILGESGSGKSVSASAIMGILDSPPGFLRSGKVVLDGVDILRQTRAERRRLMGKSIAMIFQDTLAHLNPVYSVGWQIAESFRTHLNLAKNEANDRAVRLLEQVGIPNAVRRAGDFPHQFSGGQRQRVMIAMALALEPKILIADEPTTALDVTVQAKILDLLIEMRNQRDMGLIMITHDLGVAAEVADRILVMNDGEIVEHGVVSQIYANPKHSYTQKLLGAIPGLGNYRETQHDASKESATPLLRVEDLTKHYITEKSLFSRREREIVKACNNVNFDLYQGETLGIVGESGSGKTTVVNMLLKLIEPTSGSAQFKGEDIFTMQGQSLLNLRRQVQAVFQDPYASLNPRMSVLDIISEPWVIHSDVVEKRDYKDRVVELLQNVGMLPDHAERYPHEFSGGQRQRIAIARALALQPQIIVCDEAVSALDVSVQSQIIELLAKLRDERGLSYLFIAHDLPVVKELADRVIVMKAGEIVERGAVDKIFEHPQHAYTIELLAANPIADPEQVADRRRRRGIKQ